MKKLCDELVEEYGSVIRNCIIEANAEWFKKIGTDLLVYNKRTHLNFIWDNAVDKLKTAFEGNPNFYFTDQNTTTYIIYKQKLLIKLKYFNRRKRPSFIHTRNASKFDHQEDFGFGTDLVHVYLAYEFDDLGMEVSQIYFSCQNGRRVIWAVPIVQLPVDDYATELPFIPAFTTNDRPKRIKVKKENEQSNVIGEKKV